MPITKVEVGDVLWTAYVKDDRPHVEWAQCVDRRGGYLMKGPSPDRGCLYCSDMSGDDSWADFKERFHPTPQGAVAALRARYRAEVERAADEHARRMEALDQAMRDPIVTSTSPPSDEEREKLRSAIEDEEVARRRRALQREVEAFESKHGRLK